jgi:hypothetical protein
MKYEGRALLGENADAVEAVVRIPDVEHPDWFALVVNPVSLRRGEHSVTLLDDGMYNAWHGSAVTANTADGRQRLMGHLPLAPPLDA